MGAARPDTPADPAQPAITPPSSRAAAPCEAKRATTAGKTETSIVNGGTCMQPDQQSTFAGQVATALDKIRPALQADGGDIELLAVEGVDARIRLKGACHG